MTTSRVPVVDEVVVVGDCAIVRGYPAYFIGLAFSDGRMRRDFEALMARSCVPLKEREQIMRVFTALAAAGSLWCSSDSGTETGDADCDARTSEQRESPSLVFGSVLSASEAALLLGLTDRQVRKLAAAGRLRGERDRAGRWRFRLSAIEAEAERRMNACEAA
jgi:excisionase family DNA binding protein